MKSIGINVKELEKLREEKSKELKVWKFMFSNRLGMA